MIWFEGPNWLGNDVLKGYGCVPLPCQPGKHDLKVAVFRPMPNSWWGKLFGFQSAGNHKDLVARQKTEGEVLIKGFGRDVTTVENMGYIEIEVNVQLKNFKASGVN